MTELFLALLLLLFVLGFQSTLLPVTSGNSLPSGRPQDREEDDGPDDREEDNERSIASQPLLLSLSKGPSGEGRIVERRLLGDGALSGAGRDANHATGT